MTTEHEVMALEQVQDVLRMRARDYDEIDGSDLEEWADAIDAYLSRAAEPVAWCDPRYPVDRDPEMLSGCSAPPCTVPLFIHPSGYARDAKRYRWLSEHEDADLYMENPGKDALDAAIDAAMAKENGNAT